RGLSRGGEVARRAPGSDRGRPGGWLPPRVARCARPRGPLRARGGTRVIEFSPGYLRQVVERLESLGSHPRGFRVAGTPEERAASAFVAAEMRGLGLENVTEEPVPVDAWRLEEAFVELADGTRFECASFGGVP